MSKLTCLELCAGSGGQSIGFDRAGYHHVALVENDPLCCATLRLNRPDWKVIEEDIKSFDGIPFRGQVDVLSAGLPCPPFSAAGKQAGPEDERDLFPAMLRLVREIDPKAVMIENVKGFLSPKFLDYRRRLWRAFRRLGYVVRKRLLVASDFGVPQQRERVIIVAIKEQYAPYFKWPKPHPASAPSVGEAIGDLMSAAGWRGVARWAAGANVQAPTVVGGSKKHGGADLGPSRTRAAWRHLGVEGASLGDAAPPSNFRGMPRLTNAMVKRIQGFPDTWEFAGGKTATYRQIGNALPPPLAEAVARKIKRALVGDVRASRHSREVNVVCEV